MRSRGSRIARMCMFGIVALPLFILVTGGIVFYLWNWLAPMLFGFKTITFWQAFGLLVLCRMLFGGFGMGGGRHRSDWGHRMRSRMQHMTPEQREAFFRTTFGIDDMPKPAQ